jgi:hypothetical protein
LIERRTEEKQQQQHKIQLTIYGIFSFFSSFVEIPRTTYRDLPVVAVFQGFSPKMSLRPSIANNSLFSRISN